jgi:hypothetical protein
MKIIYVLSLLFLGEYQTENSFDDYRSCIEAAEKTIIPPPGVIPQITGND